MRPSRFAASAIERRAAGRSARSTVYRNGAPTGLGRSGHEVIRIGGIADAEHDIGSGSPETFGDGAADAARCAGDEGRLS